MIVAIWFASLGYSQPYNVQQESSGDATDNYLTKWKSAANHYIQKSLLYDDGTYIGLGTTSPLSKFHVAGTTATDSKLTVQRSYASGWGTSVDLLAISSNTDYVASGRSLGQVSFTGEYNGDASIGAGATMRAYTTENWSSSGYGSKLEFLTVPNGSTTNTVRMTINQDGSLQLNGSTSGYVGLKPAAAAGSTTYTLPSADGTSGQVLQTNGSGTLSWLTALTSSTGWNITGNSGLTAGTNFVGTTDAVDLVFKVNSQKAGLIDDGGPTFFGYQAGNSNTATGSTGFGYKALYSNTSGDYNTANGYQALYTNTTGHHNTANGYTALYDNTTGSSNTAIGFNALSNNTTGSGNCAHGYLAGLANTTGNSNCAFGNAALFNIAGGTGNTAIGNNTLSQYDSGDYNTALGYAADRNGTYSNTTVIGNSAIVSATNYIKVGNTSVTQIGGQVGWTTYSDGRFKLNVTENVKGLEFIKKLRPVTYNMDTKAADDFLIQNMPDSVKLMHQAGMDFTSSTAIVHSGFIAQEVEQAAIESGFTSSIVNKPANDTDPYSLVYAEIVVPLVKAVQEQQQMIDSMKVVLQSLLQQDTSNKILQNNNEQQNVSNISNIELANNAILYQNVPNPFSEETVVKYFVHENCNAQITFYDEFGNQIKTFNIEEFGHGQLNISSSNLASGIYSYSLIINDKVVDTKKMLKL